MKVEDKVGKRTRQFHLCGLTQEDFLPLYNLLKKIDYTEEAVFQRLGVDDIDDIMLKFLPVYIQSCLKENTPLDKLIKIFILGRHLNDREIEGLLDEKHVKIYKNIGLLDLDNEGYLSQVAIFPCKGKFFATDHMFTSGFLHNSVYPLGMDSYLLARVLMKIEAGRTLDLCTGCGVHAIIAADTSRRVVGIDRNPRAINFAKFNALLNQADNVSFEIGDLYDPVKGEKFDWIIANPPFVPSPDITLYFRHGSSSGEGVLKRVVSGIPEHLADHGYAQLVTNLVFRENEDYLTKVLKWLHGFPVNILTLATRYNSVSSYIMDHITTDPTSPKFDEDLILWTNSYLENGIIAIGDGLIFMKKADFGKIQSDFRRFQMPGPKSLIDIKSIMDVMDRFEDDDYFSELLDTNFIIPSDIQFYWEGTSPAGDKSHGYVATPDRFLEGQAIEQYEKAIMDMIARGITNGRRMKESFEKDYSSNPDYSDDLFRTSILGCLRKGIIMVKKGLEKISDGE